MVASSVTGKGQGDSKGLQKPENHCSCGACADKVESQNTSTPPIHKGCIVRHSTNSASIRVNVSGLMPSSKSCF